MACLDTSVLLDLTGRAGAAIRNRAQLCLAQAARPGLRRCTTRLSVAELWVGVERSDDPRRERDEMRELLANLDILEFNETAARQFGRITAHLQRIGRPVGDMDVLIASVAMANGQVLVTRNPKHFVGIPALEVISY